MQDLRYVLHLNHRTTKKMKNKFTILILISALALGALSAIQAYLVNNTYVLKKRAFLNEVDDLVSEIDNEQILDSLYFETWGNDLADHIADYKNGRIDQKEVTQRTMAKADSLNSSYMSYYNAFLDSLQLEYTIKYHKNLESVLIFDGNTFDSILSSTSDSPIKLFGEEFDEKEAVSLSSSRWYGERDYITTVNDSVVTESYDMEVKTQDKIIITNWRRVVLRRMSGLLIGSILLFLFVIALLYYSIKNLITQKKIAEVKTDFINNITHELKTPLATLGIATKSLRNEAIKSSPSAFDTTLGIVERQNNRLQKLIDQVLTNSLSAEEIQLSKEQIVDNTFFSELIADFKLSTQHSDLTIHNKVHVPEILLRIDRFHFTTALLNILENAIKYGKDHTEITIYTAVKHGNYIIHISDNGIGISPKDQKVIFDKFYRVSDGNVHDVKGLGLGLYFTHQIITAHKGTITTESELNKGTTFIIKLPV